MEDGLKSLTRAFRVLECVAEHPGELGVSQLALALGMHKSTAHHIIKTLLALSCLEKDAQCGKYRLGQKLLGLLDAGRRSLSVGGALAPHLAAVADAVGELVLFGKLEGAEVVTLHVAHPRIYQELPPVAGGRAPAYCTAMGKALLAKAGAEALPELVSLRMESYTPRTITDPDALALALTEIRQLGYAVDDMEYEFGVKGIAVVLSDATGEAIGCVEIRVPSARFTPQKQIDCLKQLKRLVADTNTRS